MKKNIVYLIVVFLTTSVFFGCKEDKLEPLEKSTTPPGPVSNVSIKSGPGKAEIQYSLPNDKDLLYVKAVYTLASGKVMEVKSSYYDNKLTVEGFGDTEEHEVKLYAVNRSELSSAPVSVKVKPLENPIWEVFRSLDATADFGGVKLKASNPALAELAIEVMIESKGEYVPTARNIYTSSADIDFSTRGLDTIPYKFAITIRDRWLNYSDTLYKTIKPHFETILPKSDYKPVTLPSDVAFHPSTALANLWDGDTNGWPRVLMTSSAVLTPQWFTFDIGKPALLSRIVIWDYPEYLNSGASNRTYFYGGNLLEFEIWGTNNPPSDGSFTNWVKLGTFKSSKPSKAGYGVNTADDVSVGAAGLNYSFDAGNPKVRYLRIRSIKNWQGTTFMAIGELQLYGDPR